jgi:hypothetical protein
MTQQAMGERRRRRSRGVARILLFIVPIAMWLFVFPLLGMDVDIRIGG